MKLLSTPKDWAALRASSQGDFRKIFHNHRNVRPMKVKLLVTTITLAMVGACAQIPKPPASAETQPVAAVSATDDVFTVETDSNKAIISPAFFQRVVNEDPSKLAIIDVRSLEQCKVATWPDAQCIPLEEIENHLASLPANKPVVFTCTTGSKAGKAFLLVRDKQIPGEFYLLNAEVEVVDGKIRLMDY